jgi:hypothetical protein
VIVSSGGTVTNIDPCFGIGFAILKLNLYDDTEFTIVLLGVTDAVIIAPGVA